MPGTHTARRRSRGPTRVAGLAIPLAVAVGLPVLFLVLVLLTRGAAGGLAALLGTIGAAALLCAWSVRRRPRQVGRTIAASAVAVAVAASVCIPTVSTTRRPPPDPPSVATEHLTLATGSRVAVYHYPPAPGTTHRAAPLVYLDGGPVRGDQPAEHRFLRRFAEQGYDVYLYEPAGAGRSGLLPVRDYSIDRSVRDFAAVVDALRLGPVDAIGFSSGAVVLTRALADPATAARVRRAVIAEPGPMDGPTAALAGHTGRPNASATAPAPSGPRATDQPRYAVAFALLRLGVLAPDAGLVGQAEGINAIRPADLGADATNGYCAADAGRIPDENPGGTFSFNPAASQQVQDTIRASPSILPGLSRSRTPAMLMIAECSSQVRAWETAVLADPAVERVQYLPGVGHHMWPGLDDDDDRAYDVVARFLEQRPAPLPDWPTRRDVPAFLRSGA